MSLIDATEAPVLPVQPSGEEVILWSKPSCVQCTATERKLTEKGIPFRHLDLTENPEALDAMKRAGLMQAPVVQHASLGTWTGYRPDLIDQVADRVAA